MSFSWIRMTPAQHAEYERLLGPDVVETGRVFWRRVRPFFYRPLQHWREFDPAAVRLPTAAAFGCAQFAVPPGFASNSFLNYLAFDHPERYSVDSLDYNRKRQIRLAAKEFVVRPVTEVKEFRELAYPAYVSFYERTGYRVGSNRRNASFFSSWADALFKIPGVLVLGGYHNGCLGGISLSLLIEDTVVYAMFFCDTESVRLCLADLMLHAVRTAAAATPGILRISTGMYRGRKGVDTFYLLRGATIVRAPAVLRMNPLAAAFLRRCLPRQYARLLGSFGEDERLSAKHPSNAGAGTPNPPLPPTKS